MRQLFCGFCLCICIHLSGLKGHWQVQLSYFHFILTVFSCSSLRCFMIDLWLRSSVLIFFELISNSLFNSDASWLIIWIFQRAVDLFWGGFVTFFLRVDTCTSCPFVSLALDTSVSSFFSISSTCCSELFSLWSLYLSTIDISCGVEHSESIPYLVSLKMELN